MINTSSSNEYMEDSKGENDVGLRGQQNAELSLYNKLKHQL